MKWFPIELEMHTWEMYETRKWEVHVLKRARRLERTVNGAASFYFRGDSGKWLPFGTRKAVNVRYAMQVVPCDYDGQVWAVPRHRLTQARKAFGNTTKVSFEVPEFQLSIREGKRRLCIRCFMLASNGSSWF